MIRLSGQRFARFIKKLENGELRLISDEFWLTIPVDDACADTRADGRGRCGRVEIPARTLPVPPDPQGAGIHLRRVATLVARAQLHNERAHRVGRATGRSAHELEVEDAAAINELRVEPRGPEPLIHTGRLPAPTPLAYQLSLLTGAEEVSRSAQSRTTE